MELKRDKDYFLKWLIWTGDVIVINVVFWTLFFLLPAFQIQVDNDRWREVLLCLNFSYLVSLYFVPIRIHSSVVFMEDVTRRAIILTTIQTLLFAVCLLFLGIKNNSSFIQLFFLALTFVFVLWRIIVRLILKWYRRKGYYSKQVIIVGAGKNGLELYRVMKTDLGYGFNVLGFFDDNLLLKKELPNYLGMTHEVEPFLDTHNVDEIYCTLPGKKKKKILRLMNYAEKNIIRFYIIPEIYRNVKKSLVLDIMDTVPILSIRKEPLELLHNRILKRAFDILFSLTVLILIYPFLYVIVGTLIKLSSPGPVLFRQKRTGLYGKDFTCFKFRTMRVNREADELQATKDDPRNTRIGSFLRRNNLDEFPQFWNVLKGDMSVVGPRPHMLKHTELYSNMIDRYMVRHLVKPGITGWAQVTGYRGETKSMESMAERVKRDVWYIENWSFLLDLKIITVTVFNMIKGEDNAY